MTVIHSKKKKIIKAWHFYTTKKYYNTPHSVTANSYNIVLPPCKSSGYI